MLRLHLLDRFSLLVRFVAIALISSSLPLLRAEVIYDNTSRFLKSFFTERVEYGDQLDLEGSGRRLRQIAFEYFGQFAEGGDERVKVRLYTNETPYDRYRKGPTTLLYESDWIPIRPGYNSQFISGLNVVLPQYTVTFTVEFSGIAEDEAAGLLFYDPPTVGYSFNEIWLRGARGNWVPVLYSTSDPFKRASVGLRLFAESDALADQRNTTADLQLAMRDRRNAWRFAQTFSPEVSGRLDHVILSMRFTNNPARIRILDTVGQAPGPNVLGSATLPRGAGDPQSLYFTDQAIYLKAGATYAIEWSTTAGLTSVPSYLIPASRDPYRRGELWLRNEVSGPWVRASENQDGWTHLDACFETFIVSSEPFTVMTSPRPNAIFDAGEAIVLKARHRPPEIGAIARVRFLVGTNEIASITNAPFSFLWTNAPPGDHFLRAIAEDTFRRPFRSEHMPIWVRSSSPPANDHFTNRLFLSGVVARSTKPVARATPEPGEPRPAPGYSGRTLWWSWTAYDNSLVSVSARSTPAGEASVAVYQGDLLPSLTLVTKGISQADFFPEPGRTYSIVVEPKTAAEFVTLDVAVIPETPVRLTQISALPGGDVALRFNTFLSREHYVEYSDDLLTWRRVQENIPGDRPEVNFADSGSPLTVRHPREAPARFYRIVAE
jgi:hypothetical protein